jgi:signal transduction histidine kinase
MSSRTTLGGSGDGRAASAGVPPDQVQSEALAQSIASKASPNHDVPIDVPLELREFHDELRGRIPVIRWSLAVFAPVLVGWSLFDYLLVPEYWRSFFVIRLIAALVGIAAAVIVSFEKWKRRTWEALWVTGVAYCTAIALMMPLVGGENLSRFILGYIVVIIALGVFPEWPTTWVLSAIGASLAVTILLFLSRWEPGDMPVGDVITSSFVVLSLSAVSVVVGGFRYTSAKRDYLGRLRLSAIAKRESEARLNLARTSTELERALADLKELDRLKSTFFANISHELRTPLTLILAPLDRLMDVIEDPDERQQLRVIGRNAQRLLGLINDLLDLSRLDAGGLRLNLAEMDVRTVAATIHETSLPAARAKSIDFSLRGDSAGRKIWGDAHRLEIVLTNLVSNAIKFTPRGGRIEMRIADLEDGVRLEVEDTGPGIPTEDLPRVFERFFQVDPSDRRRRGGVGIGLALAKELVELHGGTISVESELGAFSRFTVFLPFGQEHIRPEVVERRKQLELDGLQGRRADDRVVAEFEKEVADEEPPSEAGAGVEPVYFEGHRRARILLAEDHQEVRDFIKTLLQPHYDVILADNGREACDLVRAESPDLVVSDVMMPEMSGTELARTIKSDPALRATPIILLTARVGSEATLEAYAHGADDFVAKPFHPRVLMARIRAQLRLRALGLQLAQQEKLAAVGTLAAGILHEVRNPVNAILNAARVLSAGRSKPELTKQLIDVIANGAKRIEGISTALDSHARPADSGVTHSCDVREGLDATLTLLSHRLEGITVHREYTTDRLARAAAGPVNQVLLNLIDNAIRAGAGTIWLNVEEERDDLCVSVRDDGPGIPAEDATRVFNPFFTKRKDGTGTGLGLYLSRRMIEEQGGSLELAKRTGPGACFVLRLPVVGKSTGSRRES